jgi:hypothetical protein
MRLVYVTFGASESGNTNGDTLSHIRIVSSTAHTDSVQNRQRNTGYYLRQGFAGRRERLLPPGVSLVFQNVWPQGYLSAKLDGTEVLAATKRFRLFQAGIVNGRAKHAVKSRLKRSVGAQAQLDTFRG